MLHRVALIAHSHLPTIVVGKPAFVKPVPLGTVPIEDASEIVVRCIRGDEAESIRQAPPGGRPRPVHCETDDGNGQGEAPPIQIDRGNDLTKGDVLRRTAATHRLASATSGISVVPPYNFIKTLTIETQQHMPSYCARK